MVKPTTLAPASAAKASTTARATHSWELARSPRIAARTSGCRWWASSPGCMLADAKPRASPLHQAEADAEHGAGLVVVQQRVAVTREELRVQAQAAGQPFAGVGQRAEPFQPRGAVAVGLQRMPQRQREDVLAVGLPAGDQLAAADVVADARVVVVVAFVDPVPHPRMELEVVLLGAREQVDAVPAARQRQGLAVGLVHHSDPSHAQAPFARL